MEPPAAAARASCRRRPLLCLLLAALCMPPGERPFREGLVGGEAGAAGGRAPRGSRPSVRPLARPQPERPALTASRLTPAVDAGKRAAGERAAVPRGSACNHREAGGRGGSRAGAALPAKPRGPERGRSAAQRSAARGGSGGTGGCFAPRGAPRPPLVPGALQPSGVRRLYFVNIELESEV